MGTSITWSRDHCLPKAGLLRKSLLKDHVTLARPPLARMAREPGYSESQAAHTAHSLSGRWLSGCQLPQVSGLAYTESQLRNRQNIVKSLASAQQSLSPYNAGSQSVTLIRHGETPRRAPAGPCRPSVTAATVPTARDPRPRLLGVTRRGPAAAARGLDS